MQQHIALYVNDYRSISVREGRRAVEVLFEQAAAQGIAATQGKTCLSLDDASRGTDGQEFSRTRYGRPVQGTTT